MRGKRKSERDEADLFRRSVGDVTPVRQDSIHPRPSKPEPIAAQRLADEAAVIKEMAEGFFDTEAAETGEELLYKTTGVQDKVFKKLRRGQFAVTAELDLHGYTVQHARTACPTFLNNALPATTDACASSTARDCAQDRADRPSRAGSGSGCNNGRKCWPTVPRGRWTAAPGPSTCC